MSAPSKTWHLLPHDQGSVERLAASLRVSPIVAQLLLNRRLHEPDQARRFLDAPLNGLHPPDLLPGVSAAADRLLAAARAGKRVCVYGDYDVDGTSGTAILLQALRLLDAQVDIYVPHRLEEGYGLNAEALRQIAAAGTSVVVTVDCGIASVAEAEEAKRLGLELIVTDHHEMKPQLPDAAVLVHPRLPGSEYPFGGLSGAAVAFKLAWALAQRACGGDKVTPRFRDFLLDAVALAALGVVADVMPLHDENRIFVRHGLSRLRTAPSVGLAALIGTSGAVGASLKASDIAFKLGPRLNAAGRLDCARLVVELLTTTSPQKAADLARVLEDKNQKRQQLERQMVAEARERVEADGLAAAPALVLASAEWHPGIIGIVAGRLAELYGRPALLVALRPEANGDGAAVGQGSGRSVPGFPLHEALAHCGEHLLSHGGHKAAAGFKLRAQDLDRFRSCFCEFAARHFPSGPPAPRLVLDAEVPLSALTSGLLSDLDRLEPYGAENGRPVFLAGGLQILGVPRRIGQGERHLSFRVRQETVEKRAVAWGMGDRLDELMSAEGKCCLAFTPRVNEWQGYRSIEMEVTDFQPGPQARLA